jgi:hypothetical protein
MKETTRQRQRRQVKQRELHKILEQADDLRSQGKRDDADQLEIDAGLRQATPPDEALNAARALLDEGKAREFKDGVKNGEISRATLMKLHATMTTEQLQVYDQALIEATPDMDEILLRGGR